VSLFEQKGFLEYRDQIIFAPWHMLLLYILGTHMSNEKCCVPGEHPSIQED